MTRIILVVPGQGLNHNQILLLHVRLSWISCLSHLTNWLATYLLYLDLQSYKHGSHNRIEQVPELLLKLKF